MNKTDDIKKAIIFVNESLKNYEPGFCSLQRHPMSEKERINSFRQYIECRLNYELSVIPGLGDIADLFEGHFFEVMSVSGLDESKKRFTQVEAYLNKSLEYYNGDNLFESIEEVINYLGGTKIKFNYSKKRPKIIIEK